MYIYIYRERETAHAVVASCPLNATWSYLLFFPLSATCARSRGGRTGFSDLSADAGDLAVEGDYKGAAANIFLNVATAGFALLARIKFEKILLETPHGN